jgi:hypothetical protein
VVLLGVLALGESRWAALAAGLAAAWRPELVPWALTLSLARARVAEVPSGSTNTGKLSQLAFTLGLSLGPALLVALARLWIFGSPLPLAAVAKPSDFAHGLRYVLGGLALSGPPWLLVGARVYRGLPRRVAAFGYATLAHAGSLLLAGGDWMSFFRLWTPVLPGVVLLGAYLAPRATLRGVALRLFAVWASSSLLWIYQSGDARGVARARERLIAEAKPTLARAGVVAAVDVGWVGAATGAQVVDLAGVTDPSIARLPGGHTTKRVPSALLLERGVGTLVLLLADSEPLRTPWHSSRFYYGVDQALARSLSDIPFAPAAVIPLAGTHKQYVLLERRTR